MKNKFNYTDKQKKIILITSLSIVIICLLIGIFSSNFLLSLCNNTFIIGTVFICLYLIGFMYKDHKIFKNYVKFKKENQESTITLPQYTDNNPQSPSVFLAIGLIIFILGSILSIMQSNIK